MRSTSDQQLSKRLIRRTGIQKEAVQEVIMGQVLQAGLGQNPARQAAIRAGLPENVPAFTVNKVCGSGLKSVVLAGQAIACGEANAIIAGGMEHMTSAPYVVKSARWGQRLGNAEMTDTLVNDALWDTFYECHMGITAENVAAKFGITRAEQDTFAVESQKKTEQAIKEGKFKDEIVPLKIKQPKGADKIFDTDEHPRFGTTCEALAKLQPAFKMEGTVTAGNASGINDGAAAVLVVSQDKNEGNEACLGFQNTRFIDRCHRPRVHGTRPHQRLQAGPRQGAVDVKDLDLIEVNEAFASQSLQVHRALKWDMTKVNVLGGAIALGHPVGASGTRILVTLMYEMVRRRCQPGTRLALHRRRAGHRNDRGTGTITIGRSRSHCDDERKGELLEPVRAQLR